MKKTIFLIITVLMSFVAFAQLEVKKDSFHEVAGFVNIDLDRQTDANDNPYTVIKVKTENINDEQRHKLLFKSAPQTTIECDYKVGEVWVYISYHANYIKISGPDMGSTVFYLPYDMQGKKGYEMTLVYKEKKQYDGWGALTIKTKPEIGADIRINGKLVVQKTPYINNKMPAGKYEFGISKLGYFPVTRSIELNDGNTIELEIEMRAGTVITFTADDNTEVYADGVLLSKGNWSGAMENGSHEIVCKKPYFIDAVNTIIVEEGVNKTYEFKPEPVLGKEVTITSEPSGNVYIDDKKYGVTPLVLNDIILGPHQLLIIVEGKKPVKKTFILEENQMMSINETLYDYPTGVVKGIFSLSDTKKVYFSPGNLQYQASTKTWRFAKNQWDFIGSDNDKRSATYNGWIDLFGYGTSGYDNKMPYAVQSSSYSENDKNFASLEIEISGTNYDWGVYNTISNGNGKKWRTLTKEEWVYLLVNRKTFSGIKYAKAAIGGINGLLVLPDDWNDSIYQLNNTDKIYAKFDSNIISVEDWTNVLEKNGAVFLPAAGALHGDTCDINSEGNYWSGSAVYLTFGTSGEYDHEGSKDVGQSVRLVCPAE